MGSPYQRYGMQPKALLLVGIKLPTVEVRYKNLSADAKCEVVDGKPLPTLWNATKSIASGRYKVADGRSEVQKPLGGRQM
ncbi:unnamed protein product [Victoria cruziana]